VDLAGQVREQIATSGPVGFDTVMNVALYDADSGFYEVGGRAGRRDGDFITSPEVGPLFGAVISEALDTWWRDAGSPPVFRVVEAASGRGTLARTIKVAAPACLEALDYVMVETSAAQRELSEGIGPQFRTATQMPDHAHVVLANELLDNLGFRIGRTDSAGEWHEVLITHDAADQAFAEVTGPWVTPLPPAIDDVLRELKAPTGTDVPVAVEARSWITHARSVADRVVCFDYGASTAELATRSNRGWAQAEWLRSHGIMDLVAEGRQIWEKRAGVGDLAAIRARSRQVEAEALLDPAGLGGFVVLEWDSGNTHENSLI